MIELLLSHNLPDFPSGSAITLYEDKIYVIGDDATSILILNTKYETVARIPLFDFSGKRLPKAEKPDFETSLIVQSKGEDCLLVIGSASRPNREKALLIQLNNTTSKITSLSLLDFAARLRNLNIGEINLEGSTRIHDSILLSNRANYSNPVNTIIITTADFWENQQTAMMATCTLVLPEEIKNAGISELCYVQSLDLLLVTLTSELTHTAYDDGIIGDSYLGWIDHASEKLNANSLSPDGLVNLAVSNEQFVGEKIEGLLFERMDNTGLIVHLVSDNDQGESNLFTIRITDMHRAL